MVPHDIQSVLERLSALAEGWVRTGAIPPIERDLALEKLRRLYEELLCGPSAAVPAADVPAATDEEPVSINLDEVLSVELPVQVEELSGFVAKQPETALSAPEGPDAAPSQPEPEAVADAAQTVVSERAESSGSGSDLHSEPAAEPLVSESGTSSAAGIAPVFEAEAVSGSAPEPTDESAMAFPAEPAPAGAPDRKAAPASAQARETVTETPTEPTPAGAPDRKAVPDPAQAAETVAEARPESAQAARPEPVSQPVLPSLFGPEDPEALRRHRQKQRILMSLYDMPEPEPRKKGKPESRAQEGSGPDYPALRAEAKKPAAEASGSSEIRGSVPPPEEAERDSGSPLFPQSIDDAAPQPAAEDASAAEELTLEEIEIVPASGVPTEPAHGEAGAPAAVSEEASGAEPALPKEKPDLAGYGAPGLRTGADGRPKGAVLGDVINHDVRTLGDELAAPAHDRTSQIGRREPVTDLRQAIGINDKFLLIRDLFGGDAESYEAAIAALNAFDDLDDCLIHIAEHYAWNPNSDGAKLLMELIERKLS